MSAPPLPDLSVILVTPDDGRSLGRILRHLWAQRAAARIEILVAAARPDIVVLDEEHAVRVVQADTSTSARGRAAAIRASRAPIVVFCEDHSFPLEDAWAERILERHRSGYAAIGPVMGNANPRSAVSWANLAVEYAPFLRAESPIETEALPGHNSSYKRASLMVFDNRLEELLEAESVLHAELRARGERLLLDPAIRVEHLNYSKALWSIPLQFLGGRMYAASRAERWAGGKRIAYGLAWPLIPPLRLVRTLKDLMQLPGGKRIALRAAPMIALLLLASGFGEGLGYLFGDGGKRNALARLEFNRHDKLLAEEQALAD